MRPLTFRSKTLLDAIQKDKGFTSALEQALGLLHSTRLFNFLYSVGAPHPSSGTDIHATAYQAAFSAGYTQAINDLIDFRETFLSQDLAPVKPPMKFGSLDIAEENNWLTKEEIDAIRTGTRPVNYPTPGSKTNPSGKANPAKPG